MQIKMSKSTDYQKKLHQLASYVTVSCKPVNTHSSKLPETSE